MKCPYDNKGCNQVDTSGMAKLKECKNCKRSKKKIHGNIKCDCGHTQKDHYLNEGWCHHSQHPQAGKCGCTWFHPNVKYILYLKKNSHDN